MLEKLGGRGGLNIYFYLLFVGFVLCLSFLVLVGGLDWSLCLTHGRHVSLDVFFDLSEVSVIVYFDLIAVRE